MILRAAVGERALGLYAFDDFADYMDAMDGGNGTHPSSQFKWWQAMRKASGISRLDQLAYLRLWDAGLRGVLSDDPSTAATLKAMQKDTPVLYLVSKVWFHTPTDWARTMRQFHAKALAGSAAIACVRYMGDTQRTPASLESLVPDYLAEVPADPFAAAPLQYIVTDQAITVYSVGHDNTDNGGVERDGKGRDYQVGTDIVFVVPRSAAIDRP